LVLFLVPLQFVHLYCNLRLKVIILPLDLPCSGPVTHSREILTTDKSHGKKLDRYSLNDNMDVFQSYDLKYSRREEKV
jgi:hypothetical protein